MRDLKFRAWDKENKIFQPVCVDTNGNACIFGYAGLEIKFDNIQQYTGLKDKNGKEIYEGDIIRRTYKASHYLNIIEEYDYIETIEVKWDDDNLSYNIPNNVFSFFSSPATHSLNPNGLPMFEIIGNIFENPELINK